MRGGQFRIEDLFVPQRRAAQNLGLQHEQDEIFRLAPLDAQFALAVLLLFVERRVEMVPLYGVQGVRNLPAAVVACHENPQQKLLLVVRQLVCEARLSGKCRAGGIQPI